VEVRTDLTAPPPARPAAVAFGTFDGVHLGHQALLAALRAGADGLGGPATVLTFEPHPLAVLRPEQAPPAVDPLATRLELLAACGMDIAVVLPFDRALAERAPDWFGREVLLGHLGARLLVTGRDTRFGCGGAGDVALLQTYASEVGAQVAIHPGVQMGGERVSSSRVRAAVAAGDVAAASALLGRPFCLRGSVVRGDGRGRQLGFATANVAAPDQVQPGHGVYVCLVDTGEGPRAAVTNVGMRPTFAGSARQVEAHVLDFAGDLYDRPLALHFLARLRDEQRFAGLDALVAQIARDVAATRRHFEKRAAVSAGAGLP